MLACQVKHTLISSLLFVKEVTDVTVRTLRGSYRSCTIYVEAIVFNEMILSDICRTRCLEILLLRALWRVIASFIEPEVLSNTV